ncbi:MAG: M67 family metallopeptidase [Anaerolineaceae bacterium]|nr:M67 family metallopeptidase [Anaerolineaceae bacterium]
MQLRLEQHLVAQLLNAASSGAPNEACGLLGGKQGNASRFIAIDNVAANPSRRYEMDSSQLVKALFAIERDNLELSAIWHSHPRGRPLPSPEDIRAAAWPGVCQLILGVVNGRSELAAWEITSGEVRRVPLQIGNAAPDLSPEEESDRKGLIIWGSAVMAVLLALWLAFSLLPPAPRIP